MVTTERSHIVIAIDGPSGSGKSTVARKLAKRLGFVHLNSGALFRAVGKEAEERGINLDNDLEISRLAGDLCFTFVVNKSGESELLVDGQKVDAELSSQHVAELASKVAVLPSFRQVLVEVQRDAAKKHPLVLEGRDAGTIVFPQTPFKFYLAASLEIRAKRRFEELKSSGAAVSLEAIKKEIAERDERDSTRAVAPHYCSEDATVVETSVMSADEVVEKIHQLIQEKHKAIS